MKAETGWWLRRQGGALAFTGAGHGLGSLINFGITLYLVQAMKKSEFGLYGVGVAVILVLAGLFTSLMSVQFAVNVADEPIERRSEYALHHTIAIVLLGVVLIAVAAMIACVLEWSSLVGTVVSQLMVPIAVGTAFFSLRDLLMRVALCEGRARVVVGMSAAVVVPVAIGFIAIAASGAAPRAGGGLYVYAAGQAAACIYGAARVALPWRSFNARCLSQAFADAWVGGRWALLTSLIYSARAQAHVFVVTPILGVAALAEINAARVLVTPAVMAIPPVTQVLIPRLAERRRYGSGRLLRTAAPATAALAVGALLYSLLLLSVLPHILPLTVGSGYADVDSLVVAWCGVTVLLGLRGGLTMTLEAIRAFRYLMLANLAVGVVAVAVATRLAQTFGAVGAVYALGLAEMLLCGALVAVIAGERRKEGSAAGTQALYGQRNAP